MSGYAERDPPSVTVAAYCGGRMTDPRDHYTYLQLVADTCIGKKRGI